MVYKVPSTMVRGYCTLFLIKIGQWSGVLCPLTVVRGAWIRVQGWVGGIGKVLFCFLKYFPKKFRRDVTFFG